MSRGVKITIGVLAFIIALAVMVPMLVSTDDVFAHAAQKVEETTGRTLSIKGEKRLKLFPSLVVSLNDVRFSNFKDSSEPNMATMASLDIHIPWLSILSGDFTISRFSIDGMNLLLEKSKSGKANWEMVQARTAETEDETPDSTSGASIPDSVDVVLGDIEITNSNITFTDHQTEVSHKIEQIEVDVNLLSLRKPLSVEGALVFQQETFELNLELSNPIDLLEKTEYSVKLGLESRLLDLNFGGKIDGATNNIKGNLITNIESVKNLTTWQNIDLNAKPEAFNTFNFKGDMTFANNQFSATNLQADLDDLSFKGQTEIAFADIPNITGQFELGELDVNPYLPEAVESSESAAEEQENASKKPIQWDDTPIDLSALKNLNADISISATSLKAKDIKLGSTDLSITLQSGNADIRLTDFNAYEGKGTGSLSINSGSSPVEIGSQFTLTGINAEPLLADAIGFDKLLGKGGVNWNLKMVGNSQKDWIASLNGSLGFQLNDGAVKGGNLAAIARSAESALKGDFNAINLDQNFSNAEKTDFAELKGDFNFTQGNGRTDNIALLNPLIRVNAQGDINLPPADMNIQVQTKLVSSKEGQGATEEAKGITIPIKIKGPFNDLKIRPDVSGAAKEKLENKVKDKLKDKLKGLFGGG